MTKVLKMELNRAFHGIGMLAACILGTGCIFYQVIPIIKKWIESVRIWEIMDAHDTWTRGGFYVFWLPSYFDGATLYYFYFLGIIAALPFGISYYRDKKSGVIKNICNRTEKKTYLTAKYIAVFLSAGTAAVLPLIIDFLAVKLIIPVDCFEVGGNVLSANTEWHAFLLDHPYLSAVIILLLWFLFSGALGTICLMVSSVSNNFFSIQLMPFFVMMVLFYLPTFLPVKYGRYFPLYFLTLFGRGNPLIAVVESAVILAVTYSVFLTVEAKRDIL